MQPDHQKNFGGALLGATSFPQPVTSTKRNRIQMINDFNDFVESRNLLSVLSLSAVAAQPC